MDVIYYNYYLFYKKILNDNEPHLLTTMALSASEAIGLNISLNFLMIKLFCYKIPAFIMISIVVGLVIINAIYFHKTGRAKRIVDDKPAFFSNGKLSAFLTAIFFLFTLSLIFWGSHYAKYLLECNCP